MRAKRTPPAARSEQLLDAGLALAEKSDYRRITAAQVGDRVGCAQSLVTHYFGTMTAFRRDLMRAAVKRGNARIVAQGLACGDAHARKASDTLKAAAAALMVG